MRTEEERFWEKVNKTDVDGCWPWIAGKTNRGYGTFREALGGKMVVASRKSYELVKGPIAPGLQIDHLCRNPVCVNPAHLESVTPSINVLRGDLAMVTRERYRAKTHCPQSHLYEEKNIYRARGTGPRRCRICRKHQHSRDSIV